ncbi:LysM peptidoglycan-binding domain-containing protein [Oleiharenicola lentus]|uniref:LysM peptidoglycan-binding domain-containing protein n=1 Tax=Oleiharenicola lentus TaxID=2508720 RepID=UPI003F67F5D2
MYQFTTLTGLVKHLKVRRLFACVLLLAVVGIATSKAQQPAPADLAQIRARADQADAEAQNSLGNIYTNGLLGVKQDYAQALDWYRKAGDRGFAPAQFNLGLVYEMGRGVAADERQAFKYYLMAAEQGFAAAQFNIGNMYSSGRGVGQDLFEANLWYKQAAEKGIVEAQFNLGLGYEAGRGVKKDEVQAARWYRLAADRGFSRAQYNLGLLYEDGRGVTKNEATAASYYRAAAEQRFAPAQNNYGVMISEGRGGLAKDPIEAYVWLSLATEKGANPAARDFVARSLSPEQLVAANRTVAERKGGTAPAPVVAAPVEATAVASHAPSTPDTANATRIAELTDALNRARLANAQYAEANQRLELEKAQLAQQLSQPTEAGKLVDQLRDQSRRLAAQVESLTIEKEVSQRETSVLTAQLKDAQSAARQPATVAAPPTADAAKFKDEITTLTAQLAQANIELNQQRQTNQRLTQSNTELLEKSKVATSTPRTTSASDSARYPVQDSEKDSIIAGLQRDIIRLNDEVKRSTRELTAVNLQLRSTRNQASVSAPTAAPTSDQTAQLLAKADQAVKEASRFQEENIRLSARVADLEKQPKPTPVDATLAPRLAQAQQELQQLNTRLSSENASLTQAQARVAELEKQLSSAQQQASGTNTDVEKLRAQLAAANQSLQENASRVASLNEANQSLAPRLAQSEQELAQLNAKILAGNATLADSRTRVSELEKQLASSQQQASGSGSDVEKLRAQLAAANQSLHENNARVSSLNEANQALAPRLAQSQQELQQLNARLSAGAVSLTQAQARTAELEKQLASAQQQASGTNTDVEKLRTQLTAANQSLQENTARVAALNQANQRLEAEVSTAKQTGERAAAQAREQLAALQKDISEARKSAAGLTAARSENEKLTARLAELEKQPKPVVDETLAPKLAQAEQAAAKLQQQLQELQSEKADLEKWAQTLEKSQEEKTALAGVAAAESTALKEKLVVAEKRFADAVASAEQDKQLAQKLSEENKTLAEKANTESGPTRAALNELTSLRQQFVAEKERSERWMKSSQSMTEKAAEESGNARKAQTALAEAKNQLVTTEKKLAATTAAIQSLNAELEASKAAASRAIALDGEVAKLRTAEENLGALRQENGRLTSRIAELENQPKPVIDPTLSPRLEAAQTRVVALEKELQTAQQQAANLTAANEKISASTVAEKNLGTQAVAAANAQLAELRGQLIAAQKDAAAVASLRDQNAKLSAQVTQLEAQPKPVVDKTLEPRLAESQQKVASLENELRAAQQRLTNGAEQVNGLRGQLALASQAGAQNEETLTKALAAAETAKADLDTAKLQLTEAQKELYTLRQTAATANVLRSENMRLSGRIADLEKLAETASATQAIAPKLAEAQMRIAALEQELLAAQQQASGSGANLEELRKQLASAQERVTQSTEAMAGLRTELEAARKTAADATTLRAELTTLRASTGNVTELRDENARLAARLLDVESKPKAAAGDPALAQQLAQAQQQLRVVTDKAAADRTTYIQSQARVASLEADLRIQQRQTSGNTGEFEAVKKQLVETNAALEKANTDLVKLQSEMVAIRENASMASALKEENTQLTARITALQNQPKPVVDETLAPRLAQAQQRIVSLEKELDTVRLAASESAGTIEGLQKQLGDAQQAAAATANLRTENSRLAARVAEFEKRPVADQTLAPRLAQAQEQVKSANERISTLENDLRTSQRNVSGSAAGVEDLRKQLAAATQSLEQSQASVKELTALNSQLEQAASSSKDTQQRDIAAARAQVASVQRELASAKESAAQVVNLREEIEQLRTASADAVKLRDENTRLTARITELQNQPKPAIDDTLAPRLAQAQSRIAALEADLRATQQSSASLDSLKKQLEEANQALEKSGSNVAELTALNDRLEKDIATARESSQRELTAARTQVSDLQRQVAAAQQASTGNTALRDEVTKLRAETAGLATLRSENERLRASATTANELRAKVEQLTRENEQVTGFMTSNRRELDQAQTKVADLEKQIAATRASGSKGAEEVRKLQTDLVDANQTVEKLTASVAELTGINDRLEQDLESAKKSVSAALAAQSQAMSATQPDAYKMEIRTLTAQIKDLETQLENDRGEAAKEFASLASQLQRARETNRSLSEANRSLMSAKQAEIPTVNKDEFDQLQGRVRDLVAVGDDLRRKNQKLTDDNQRSAADLSGLRQQLEDARKVATVLPGLADEKAALQERLEAVGTQLVAAQREIETLQRSGSDAATRLASSQQTAQRTATELAALRARATDAEKAADSHNNSVAELTDLNTKLEAERDDLRRQIVAARAESTRLSQGVASAEQTLQNRIKDLVSVGDELRRQNQKLVDDNRKASEDQAALRQQLDDARKVATVLPGLADEKAALQERLEAVGTQLATAQRENATLRRTGDDATTRLASSQQATQRVEAELAALRARATDAEKAADTHNSSVAELTDLNSKLETERDDLRRQIASARAENTRIAQTATSAEQLKVEADRSAQQNIDALTVQLAQVRRELQTVRDINTRAAEVNVAQERERAAALNQLRQENSALVARLTQAQGTLDQIASAARLATPASMLASGGNPPVNTQSSTSSTQQVARYHTVTEGDSLSRISLRYYGTANRWQDIFQANREVLQGSNTLRVGTQLRIP